MGHDERGILTFFGRIAAGFTHEVKNIFAIIQESSGLVQDILNLKPVSDPEVGARLSASLETIQAQVRRGMVLTTHFNRFAHSTDSVKAPVDLLEFIERSKSLFGRFARMKQMDLEKAPDSVPVTVETDPALLYMVFFHAILAFVEHSPPLGGSLVMGAGRHGSFAFLKISAKPGSRDRLWDPGHSRSSLHLDTARAILGDLNGELEISKAGEVELLLPLS